VVAPQVHGSNLSLPHGPIKEVNISTQSLWMGGAAVADFPCVRFGFVMRQGKCLGVVRCHWHTQCQPEAASGNPTESAVTKKCKYIGMI
jgi:hypothetical protein